MFQLQSALWLGDESSLRHLIALESIAMNAAIAQGTKPGTFNASGEEKLPRLYTRHNNIGVITIRGGLINVENFMTEFFGIATYPAIRDAVAFAASDAKVDRILLDIESPGGMVSGVNDVANLIREVRATKPITAFSDGLMASAAYWIGSAANKIFVGETAIVGSIGVISTIVSYADSLKKEGVDVRVVRAGKNKALGHPAEPISDKAVKQVQERADAIYEIFTTTVMANRSKLKSSAEDTWAQGNEFLGQDAVGVHLADSVSTFDRVVAQLAVDKSNSLHNTSATKIRGSDVTKPRAVLDEKLVAAIASGAELSAEQKVEVEAARADAENAAKIVAAEATAKAAKDVADAAAKKVADDAAAAAVTAAAAEAAKKPADNKGELVAYLEGQVAALRTELATAQASAATAQAAVADMKPPYDALVEIAANSINKMAIALGGSASDLKSLSGKEIVAKHAATLPSFEKAFPVGGVASTAPEDKTTKKPAETAVVTSFDAAKRRMSALNPQGGK